MLVVLAVSSAVAAASWRWVEQPAITWAAQRRARRRPQLTRAEPAVADAA
jgi:peptidoglycan/LPS O-acetylase OafA/YrhL